VGGDAAGGDIHTRSGPVYIRSRGEDAAGGDIYIRSGGVYIRSRGWHIYKV
jgi:hypothetical protein